MNSKQRRKLIRKHIKSIALLRVEDRLKGGNGWDNWTDYEIARALEAPKSYTIWAHVQELMEA